jgi:ABC-type spermidine/putrescine transport system permease subunit II
MNTKKRGENSMKWQKIAAYLLVIALVLPLLVSVAGPLSSDNNVWNPDSSEFWSNAEFQENCISSTLFDSVAVNWGSRIVIPNIEKRDPADVREVAVNWGSRTVAPTNVLS